MQPTLTLEAAFGPGLEISWGQPDQLTVLNPTFIVSVQFSAQQLGEALPDRGMAL